MFAWDSDRVAKLPEAGAPSQQVKFRIFREATVLCCYSCGSASMKFLNNACSQPGPAFLDVNEFSCLQAFPCIGRVVLTGWRTSSCSGPIVQQDAALH